MRRNVTVVVGLTLALVIVSAPHTAEDFSYGIFAPLGISTLAAGFVLGLMYAVQAYGAYLAGRGTRTGSVLLGLAGAVWSIGALAIHGREVFSSSDFRHGFISKALVVAIIGLGALTAAFGLVRRR